MGLWTIYLPGPGLNSEFRGQPYPGPKKHSCPESQMCAETRCNLCGCPQKAGPRLSLAGQIALYERISAEEE